MNDYLTRNRTILAKIEATPGTDPTPVVGTDAVLIEAPEPGNGLQSAKTREVTGSLDPRSSVFTGGNAPWSGKSYLKGSGTAGTAPEWGKALARGCGLAPTLTAAAITGTAQAGAAGTITLDAGDAGATSAYIGMVIATTGGTGSGQTRVITANNGTSKVVSVYPNWSTNPDATTTYSIYANALYIPASTGNKNVTIYDYQHASTSGVDSRLQKIIGAMGNARFTIPAAGIPSIDWQFQGQFSTPTDVTKPSAATYDATRPVAILGATFNLNSVATKFGTISIDLGNQVQQPPDPSATYGMDVAAITERSITMTMDPQLALLSVRNAYSALIAGTSYKGWLSWGSTSGNRFSIYWPGLVFTQQGLADLNGFRHENITADCTGEDSGFYLCAF